MQELAELKALPKDLLEPYSPFLSLRKFEI
jgi:hypothetical protein